MIRFGTGGWRAVIGDDFTAENIRLVAKGVATFIHESGKADLPVIIGHDRRFLSDTALKWITEVLVHEGIHVLYILRSVPTPLIMHTVKKKGYAFGLEITASHNPASYNGIKLIVEEGRDASVEVTKRLEEIIASIENEPVAYTGFEECVASGMAVHVDDPFNEYIDDILGLVDGNLIRSKNMRILFDPMHGSGVYPMLAIMYTNRVTLDMINGNRDTLFGGTMPAPSEDRLSELRRRVVEEGYSLGIALDGDGDRLGIIDRNGRYIDANETLCMLYYYLHEYKGYKGPVVRNIASTHMLDKIAESFGEKCIEVPVGFKYVSAALDENDAVLGGESSGGLTVRGHIFGKDSIYAASLFVEMICAIGMSATDFMAKLEERYGRFRMAESNLEYDPKDKGEIDDLIMVQRKLPNFGVSIARVSYEDGCKVYFENGDYIICRFSGTEPLLRIFAESSTIEKAKEYISIFSDFVFNRNN